MKLNNKTHSILDPESFVLFLFFVIKRYRVIFWAFLCKWRGKPINKQALNYKKIIKKTQQTSSIGQSVEVEKLDTLLTGMLNGVAATENSMVVPQKIKTRITIWSSNPTSG